MLAVKWHADLTLRIWPNFQRVTLKSRTAILISFGLVKNPQEVKARESEVDPSDHARPLLPDMVDEEEEGVEEVVAAAAHV